MPVATIVGLLLFAAGVLYLIVNWNDDHKWALTTALFAAGGLACYADHTGGMRQTTIGSGLILLAVILMEMAVQEIEAQVRQHGFGDTSSHLLIGFIVAGVAFIVALRYISPDQVEDWTDLVIFGYLATGCLAAKLVWRQARQPQEVPQTGPVHR